MDFPGRARLGEGDGNGAAYNVWQIQADHPLSKVAQERKGLGQGFIATKSLDGPLLAELIACRLTALSQKGALHSLRSAPFLR